MTYSTYLTVTKACNFNKEMKISPEAYRTIEQIKTDLFGSEFFQNYPRAFGKLHKDILGK